jgi:hypothetical protein
MEKGMEILTARDVDELLAECIEELPGWVLTGLGDTVIRVEPVPPSLPCEPTSHLMVIYRAPLLAHASGRAELRRLTRAELLRLVVERLDLQGTQAVELAAVCL